MATATPLCAFYGHHKCATQWITAILSDLCDATRLRLFEVSRIDDWDFADLPAFLACFRPDVLVYSNADIDQVKRLPPVRGFHVVRDPRDLVVSAYFSHLHSHSLDTWPGLAEHRRRLQAVDEREGLLLEMEFSRRVLADIGGWDYSRPEILEVRLEDLAASPAEHFVRIVRHLGLTDLPPSCTLERLVGLAAILHGRGRRLARRLLARRDAPTGGRAAARLTGDPYRFYPLDLAWRHGLTPRNLALDDLPSILERHDFARKSGGRRRGVEDVRSHYRKGVAGDWRRHFEAVHVEHFRRHYNDTLITLGYETDPDWA